ncbi:ribosomal RNA small subunit methyltransferase [Tanacetum coccineum]
MLSSRIHHGGKFQRCPGRMYSEGHVDIFDMVDINLFTVVALKMMIVQLGYTGKSEPLFNYYLRPLTSLDEGLYALACEDDNRPPPQFRATIIEEIIDKPRSNVAIEHRSEKMLLFTWHDSSEPTTELVCDSVTPKSLTRHDSSTPCKGCSLWAEVNSRTHWEEVRNSEPCVEEVRNSRTLYAEVIVKDFVSLCGRWIYIAYEAKYEGQSSEDADYVSSGEDVEQGIGQEESAPSDEQLAIHSYTEFFKELDKGNIENVKAPAIAVDYWRLPADATLLDVVMVVREDEAHHRDVNHFASVSIDFIIWF